MAEKTPMSKEKYPLRMEDMDFDTGPQPDIIREKMVFSVCRNRFDNKLYLVGEQEDGSGQVAIPCIEMQPNINDGRWYYATYDRTFDSVICFKNEGHPDTQYLKKDHCDRGKAIIVAGRMYHPKEIVKACMIVCSCGRRSAILSDTSQLLQMAHGGPSKSYALWHENLRWYKGNNPEVFRHLEGDYKCCYGGF